MMKYPDIAKLLPHSGPMIFLDRIISFDGVSLTAVCFPENTHGIDGADGSVEVWAGFEYIGQATAAFFSLSCGRSGPPRPGYLVSIRDAQCFVSEFNVGQEIRVRVTLEDQHENFSTFWGSVSTFQDKELVKGRFGVYIEK